MCEYMYVYLNERGSVHICMYVITYVYNTQFGYNISSSVVAIRVKLLDDVYVCMDSMMYVCMYVCMFGIQSPN